MNKFQNRLEETQQGLKEKKSGFFDLDKKESCNNPEHEPPKLLHIPQGKGYRHVCPSCGKVQTLIPPQVTL